MSVEITLAHELTTGVRALVIREPTIGDLIEAGDYVSTSKSFDEERRITTEAKRFDPQRFAAFLAPLAGISEQAADSLALADLPQVRAVLDQHLGADRNNLLKIADALVFDLEWSPSEVEQMTPRRLLHWHKRAVDRQKRHNQ